MRAIRRSGPPARRRRFARSRRSLRRRQKRGFGAPASDAAWSPRGEAPRFHLRLFRMSDASTAVTEYLARTGASGARAVPLTGDASDRNYFRVLPRDGGSFVLSVHAAPFDYATLPFVA